MKTGIYYIVKPKGVCCLNFTEIHNIFLGKCPPKSIAEWFYCRPLRSSYMIVQVQYYFSKINHWMSNAGRSGRPRINTMLL